MTDIWTWVQNAQKGKRKLHCRICIDKGSIISEHWRQHKHRATFRRIIFAKHQHVSHAPISNMSLLNQRVFLIFFSHVEMLRNAKQIITLSARLVKKLSNLFTLFLYIKPTDKIAYGFPVQYMDVCRMW